ncbi:MAG TPA: LPS-assembly protein LptD [Hyphomicrobiaceae bacterium]|nr:LPS-assembly protein LptD [Hyphomicrobiaceae bacterium]
MRAAPTAHNVSEGTPSLRRVAARRRMAQVWLALLGVIVAGCLLSQAALAQSDPSLRLPNLPGSKSAFPKKAGGILGPRPKIDRAQPIYIQTDKLTYDDKNNRVIAQGNVEIYYNNYILTADRVIYDQSLNKLLAEGNAQLKEPNGSVVRADRFEATDDFRDAFIQGLSSVTNDDTRIAAESAVRKEGNVTEFEKGKFTPCRNDPGMPPLWCIGAARIIHDQAAKTITYQDAQFQLFGVPVFYLPYFQHPDPTVKRQSGFLMPSYDSSSTLGFSVQVPYYFALAPNYDFTFNPHYYSDRGVLWQGNWRHRLADGKYSIDIAAIEDRTVSTLDSDLGNWRGSIQTKGQFNLASWWKYGWDVTLESDESFRRTYKLDSIFQTDRINVGYLQGISDRNYFAANLYHFGGLFLEDNNVATSYVHPVIDWNYIVGTPVAGGQLGFSAHARALTRPNDGSDSNHLVVQTDWKRKMVDPMGQVWTPFANLRGDIYSWENARNPDNPAAFIPDDTVVRGQAVAGMLYSYPFVAHTASATHVIEPTAQIIARPNNIDQRRLPDEDARSLIWDDTLLFDIDRFSGYDRYETGTRANLGMQYTLQTASGMYARFVAGQSLHLAGDNPFDANPGKDAADVYYYDPASGLQTDRSDYVTGVYLSPFAGTSVVAQARFDEHDWSLRRQDTAINASYGPLLAQVGYTYTQFDTKLGLLDDQEEAIGLLGLRLTDRWSVMGQMRYDIDDGTRIQDVYQVKYQDECFVLSASYIETFIENQALEIKPDRTLMLRFELKHLGGYNYKTDALNHVFGDTNEGSIPR